MPTRSLLAAIVLTAIVVCVQFFPVSSSQDATLVGRLATLEERVASLEARLSNLEGKKNAGSGERINVTVGNWKDRGNWRRLDVGMTEDEVRALLGEPPQISVGFSQILWYYPRASGGSVAFDKKTKRVERWSEP